MGYVRYLPHKTAQFLGRVLYSSRMSAVEAEGCQVNRLQSGLQWLHSDCLHAQHDVGGPGTFQSERGRRDGSHKLSVQDLGGRSQHTQVCLAHQKGQPLHCLQQPWALHVPVERTRNWAVSCGCKWMRASRLKCAKPHGSSPGWQISFSAG